MNISLKLVSLAVLPLYLAVSAHGQVLLDIDDTSPANVTFTATTGAAAATDTSNTFGEGIDLTTFFTAPPGDAEPPNPSSSNLTTYVTPAVPGSVYNGSNLDSLSGSEVDLQLLQAADTTGPEVFTQGTQALTGSATIDLSGLASLLPAAGTTGDIYAGYSGDVPITSAEAISAILGPGVTLIGTYVVVPEPSSWAMLILGSATALGLTIRRPQARMR
jgi:hypothetical protein